MAQPKTVSKSVESAVKADTTAVAGSPPAKAKALVESLKADAAEIVAAKPAAAPAPKPAPKPAAKKAGPKKIVAKKASPASKPVAHKAKVKKSAPKPMKKAAAAKFQPTVTQLKEKIMATKTTDFTNAMTSTMTDAVKEIQERAQAAYEKGTSSITDMTEFAKGNVEAVVESGKIFAEGVQTMGKTYADEAKSAYETATADIKEMAAIKSPTDLFQLQGKILRRNFDAMIAMTTKSTDATMKLTNDAIAPISGRVNVAAEKLSKVA